MEIGDCVAAAGVRKMVIFNSHGGQGMVGDIVARDLRVKHDMLVVATNTYSLRHCRPACSAPRETQHGIHGGDKETSVVLALRPDLVDMDKARNFRSSAEQLVSETRHLSINARAKVGWQIQDLNPDGACGDATRGDGRKGRRGAGARRHAIHRDAARPGQHQPRVAGPAARGALKEAR